MQFLFYSRGSLESQYWNCSLATISTSAWVRIQVSDVLLHDSSYRVLKWMIRLAALGQ